MRFTDLVAAAIGGLWRQKARSAFTVGGVAIGACALAFCLSLGLGLRAMIAREFESRPEFWIVHLQSHEIGEPVPEDQIPPDEIAVKGTMSEERRQRIRAHLIAQYRGKNLRLPPVQLTDERIAELKALPDVEAVETWHYQYGSFRLANEKTVSAAVVGGATLDRPTIRDRLVAGRLPTPGANECLVSEVHLYDLGFHDDAAVDRLFGQSVAVTIGNESPKVFSVAQLFGLKASDLTGVQETLLGRVASQLPNAVDHLDLTATEKTALRQLLAASKTSKPKDDEEDAIRSATESFRIVGVLRALEPKEQTDETRTDSWELRTGELFLPPSASPFFERLQSVNRWKYRSASILVRPGGDLRTVVEGVERIGFAHYSMLKWHDNAKREVTMIAAGLNLFALISLFVAALGITNTLVTSVVERTREIGILKAVGASDRQVLSLFLMEGTTVGVLGGILGLIVAWGLSFPADNLVRHLVAMQAEKPLVSKTVFEFPPWLLAGSLAFAVLTTTLAAFYPARRAARVQPVEALRHD